MMKVKIEPARLNGRIRAISSKSYAHRSLICAALADEPTVLWMPDRSADIDATAACLSAMGAEIRQAKNLCYVRPMREKRRNVELFCGESGSTLRFLLPVAAVCCESAVLSGRGRLPGRPVSGLLSAMAEHDVSAAGEGLPLSISGEMTSGNYKIEGNVSSQYISGLLFALPLLVGDSEIALTTPLESEAYVRMTVETLAEYGVRVEEIREAGRLLGYRVPGNQSYRSVGARQIEGDWSNAAFFLAAGAVGAPGTQIVCEGLNVKSTQGDRAALALLQRFGAQVEAEENRVKVTPRRLSGTEIDVSQVPDLMPILAVMACGAEGKTVFSNAGRLRIKESDRIAATAALITGLGGRAEEGPDSLTVYGTGKLSGGTADSAGDHRIAMAAAVAALMCEGPVILSGAEAVEKSYPNFFEDYNRLGGKADVI